MTLSNVGTGPAQIAWFRVVDDQGNSYSSGFYDRVKALGDHSMFLSQQISGTFVRSGDDRLVFSWAKAAEATPALAEWEKLQSTRFHLHASACYCSIFDECKTTQLDESRPKPVASCTSETSGQKP